MNSVEIKSPTRVDLAGGTLDCWPLYCLVGPSITTNISISVQTRAKIEKREGTGIELSLKDLDYKKKFKNLDELLKCEDPQVVLAQKLLMKLQPRFGFFLETESQSPVGGGLGGSSSLCVSIIKAFDQLMEVKRDLYQIVKLASDLEAKVLHKLTGTQDYYPAADPGVCAIHYDYGQVRLEKLTIPAKVIEQQLILVYTGRSHNSGINNWQVIKRAVEGDKTTLGALEDIRQISLDMYECLKSQSWRDLARLFSREYLARVKLAESFTSPEIVRLEKLSAAAGAEATKICGAGGGGCVFVWTPVERRADVEGAIRKSGFQILEARVVN